MAGKKKRRRTELREAQRALDRALAHQIAGCVTRQSTATDEERLVVDELLNEIRPREGEFRGAIARAGISDGAVVVVLPDASDRQVMRATARLLELEGDAPGAAHAREAAGMRYLVIPRDRRELLGELERDSAWPESSLALLRIPPPGAVVAVYDGHACGHGAIAIGALVTKGGSA